MACARHVWEARQSKENGMKREYPEAPVVAVGVIIRQTDRTAGEQILLVQRAQEPSKGLWTFPGGAVELGEMVRDAARREALEETGLKVEVGEVAAIVDNVVRDEAGRVQYHYLIIDFFARPSGGALSPGTDVSATRWASLADLDRLAMTEKAGQIVRRLLAGGRADGSALDA
jgi:ADP-ribose pyrophosphatase YjhB (NUDIX family)